MPDYLYGQLRPPSGPGPAPAPTGGGTLFTGDQYRNPAVAPRPLGMAGSSMSQVPGMMSSGPGGYISPQAKMSARAAMMGAGGFSRPGQSFSQAGATQLQAIKAQNERMAGAGVRPGTMPPMSAVAAARMQGQMGQGQSAMMSQRPGGIPSMNPNDPRNAALSQYSSGYRSGPPPTMEPQYMQPLPGNTSGYRGSMAQDTMPRRT